MYMTTTAHRSWQKYMTSQVTSLICSGLTYGILSYLETLIMKTLCGKNRILIDRPNYYTSLLLEFSKFRVKMFK